MSRVKLEERKQFTRDEKIFILDKSHGKCCHCGKILKLGDNFTVEHAIPLSKGGTNQPWNIVALCKECNDTKADYIVNPLDYFKFLDKTHLTELCNKQHEYYDDINWLDKYNFTKEDKKLISVPTFTPGAYKQFGRSRGKSIPGIGSMIYKQFIMEKANYSDLNEVENVYKKYIRKVNSDISMRTIHRLITDTFTKGAIYVIRNSSKEIVITLLLALVHDKELGYIVKIFIPAYTRDKTDYMLALGTAVDTIVKNMFDLGISGEYVPLLIDHCKGLSTAVAQINSLEFKVKSIYKDVFNGDKVESELSIYMKGNNRIASKNMGDIIQDINSYSNKLVSKCDLKTNNIVVCNYDYEK